MSASEYRNDPAYSDGFWDVQAGDPLFPDASPAYEAGWRAFYRCQELLLNAGFTKQDDGSFSKRTVVQL